MKQSQQQSINIKKIREIANRFDSACLDKCMQLAMAEKENPCYITTETEETMALIAKASFVRGQMEKGLTLSAAMRELGKRMRLIQGIEHV